MRFLFLFLLLLGGCTTKQISIEPIFTIQPLEENKHEVAGKEIYEGMLIILGE